MAFSAPAEATVWYVNDASTTGDSFTSALGNSANNGLTIATPKRFLNDIETSVMEGDTVYADAGTYLEPDTFRIDTNSIWIIGKDSASTIIDFNDSSPSGLKSIFASDRRNITISNLAVTRGYYGVFFNDVDTATVLRVRSDTNGADGFRVDNASDSNTFTNDAASGNTLQGFNFSGANLFNTLTGNRSIGNGSVGFDFSLASNNTLTGNTSSGNGNDGFLLTLSSNNNTLINNTSSSNGSYGFLVSQSSESNTLTNNTSSSNASYGYYNWQASNNTYTGNTSSNNVVGFFISTTSNNNTLISNTSTGNSGEGIYVWGSSNNTLTGNTSSNNGLYGYRVGGENGNNTLTQNTADSNASWGFHIGGTSSFDTFTKNNYHGSPTLPDSAVYIDGIETSYLFTRNFWGTADSAAIRLKIVDTGLVSVFYSPFRLGPVDTTPGADTVAPRAPDTVAATALSSSSIRISWSPVTANEEPSPFAVSLAAYRVYRSNAADSSAWTQIASVGAGTLSADNASLSESTTYYYRVTAADSATPFENQSFFSDSIASATTAGAGADTSGPNTWYINDAALVGDSFTNAVGNDVNNGLTASAPKRTLAALRGMLTRGDSVFIDAGTFTDTFSIDTDLVTLMGVDSALTVIDFGDSSVGTGANGIYADTQVGLTLSNFKIRNCYNGVNWINVDTSIIDRMATDRIGIYGILLNMRSDTNRVATCSTSAAIRVAASFGNTVSNCLTSDLYLTGGSESNTFTGNSVIGGSFGIQLNTSHRNAFIGNTTSGHPSHGVVTFGSTFNTFSNNTSSNNGDRGFYLFSSSDNNALTGNTAQGNFTDGFKLSQSNNNLLSSNTSYSNRGAASGVGFYLSLNSNNNTLIGNSSIYNPNDGFYIASSTDNTLVLNRSYNNFNGFGLLATQNNYFAQNTAESCAGYGYYLDVSTSNDTFFKNDFTATPSRPDSGLFNNTANAVRFTRSWWGTSDSVAVLAKIWGTGRSLITYTPFRLGFIDTTAGADTVAPRAPDTVAAVALDSSRITVTWSPVASSEENEAALGLSRYRVYQASSATAGPWALRGTVESTVLSLTDSGLAAGTAFYYRVTAFDLTSPYENQSFFSDSIASATTSGSVDTFGPNKWYVNDTSTTGDSFTSAVGSPGNTGLTPSSPFRTFSNLKSFLTSGDTVYMDAGTYFEPDSVTIDTNSIWIIGKDSVATVISYVDSSSNLGLSIFAANVTGVTIQNLSVTGGYSGVFFHNVDLSTVTGVSAASGYFGIFFRIGSDTNTISGSTANSNSSDGIHLMMCNSNTVSGNSGNSNGGDGIVIGGGAYHVVTDNAFNSNRASGGISLTMTSNNRITSNTANFNVKHGIHLDTLSSNNLIGNNLVSSNGERGINIVWGSNNAIYQNKFDSNLQYAIYIVGDTSVADTFYKNIINTSPYNPDSGVWNPTSSRFDLSRNWWGTADSAAIKQKIWGAGRDSITYIPFRLGIVDTTVGADTVAPDAPDTVAATALSSSSIKVTWSPVVNDEETDLNATNLTTYRVYQSRTSDTNWWQLAATVTASGSGESSTVTGLDSSTLYYFRVTAEDNATYPNQSWYSDTTASATTTASEPDTSGPNIWYVNDTSTAGDSFTSAVGYDTQSGLTRATPFRTLNRLEGRLTAGDTIYVDAGFYYEADTFTIDTSGVFLIGKDSTATVIDFNDSSMSGQRAIYARNQTNLVIQDLAVIDGRNGIRWTNVDSSTFQRVRSDSHGNYSVYLEAGSDSNTLSMNSVSGNGSYGIYLETSSFNTLTSNRAGPENLSGIDLYFSSNNTLISNVTSGNFVDGIVLEVSSNNNTLTSNTAQDNTTYGIQIATSSNNTFTSNTMSANLVSGFALFTATNNRFTSNTASGCGYGFLLSSSSNNTFLSNIVRNGDFSAFYLEDDGLGLGSDTNVFLQNTADSNGRWAFEIFNGGTPVSRNDTFQKNVVITSQYAAWIDSGVSNATSNRFDFTRNFWMRGGAASTDSAVIRGMTAGAGRDSIVFLPFRLGIVDTSAAGDTVAPRAPDTAAATALSSSSIKVTWSPVVNDEEADPNATSLTTYRVYQSRTSDTNWWQLAATVTASGSGESSTVAGLDSSTAYYFRVTAADNATYPNESWYSDSIVTATTAAAAADTNGPNVWYVNDTSTTGDSFTSAVGNNSSDGLTPATAKLSLWFVTPLLTAGDTVYVDAGTYYRESNAVITTANVTVMGKDSSATVLDANFETGITVRNTWGTRIEGLAIINANVDGFPGQNYGAAIRLENGDSVIVRNDSFSSNAYAVYASPGTDSLTIAGCYIIGNNPGGITLETAPQSVITGCYLGNAPQFLAGSDTGTVEGNVLVAGAFNIDLSDSMTIRNNTFTNVSLSFTNTRRALVTENTMTGGKMTLDAASTRNTFTSNVVTFSSDNCFEIGGETNTFTGNTATGGGVVGHGFWIQNGADANRLTANVAEGKRNYGFLIQGPSNVLDSNSARTCQDGGFSLSVGGDTNTLTRNFADAMTVGSGFIVDRPGNVLGANWSRGNADHGFLVSAGGNVLVQNFADSNSKYAVYVSSACAIITCQRNNLQTSVARPDSGIFFETTAAQVSFGRNWWFTTDSATIRNRVWGPGRDSAFHAPFRLSVVDTTIGADTVAPATPTGLAADSVLGRVNLAWTAPATNEDSFAGAPGVALYRIYRSAAANPNDWETAYAETTATAFHDTAIATDTDYYYRVTALDGAGVVNQSFYSAVVAMRVTRIAGDVTGDSQVTAADVILFRARYKNAGGYDAFFDIGKNGPDGIINEEDYLELGRRYGL